MENVSIEGVTFVKHESGLWFNIDDPRETYTAEQMEEMND